MRVLQAIAFIAALPVLSAQTTAPVPTPAPEDIYSKAIGTVRAYAIPAYAVWRLDRKLTTVGATTELRSQLMAARSSDGSEMVMWYPDAAPGTPLKFQADAFVGAAFSWPFAWGAMGAKPPGPHVQGTAAIPDFSPPDTIAHVTAREAPPYALELVGVEKPGERAVYHLRLRPLFDPKTHNLRDLWIDTQTFDVLAAHFVSRYHPYPGATESPTDATVYFASIAGYRIAYRIVFTYQTRNVTEVSDVTIVQVAFPASLPDWLFDQKLYDEQRKAGAPNILWDIINGASATPPPS